jgi:hypothetical protein
MRSITDEQSSTVAKNLIDQDLLPDRAFLPRNYRVAPPLQDRLTRIYYEARKRAAAASAAAATRTNADYVEIVA